MDFSIKNNDKCISLKLFQKIVDENDVIIIGENHSEVSSAFNLLLDYVFYNNKNTPNFRHENSKYCLFLEGLPNYYSKPNEIPIVISNHQKFSWFFYYLGLNIRGLESNNFSEDKIKKAKKSLQDKKNFSYFAEEKKYNNEFDKKNYYTNRIMENSKFSRNINAVIDENKFSKIFIICGSVHANDLFLKIDKYGLEQTFQGIKVKQSSKKIARILVDNVNIKKNKLNFIDDTSLLKKVKQEIDLSLPKDSLNQYNYYFDYFIRYCNVEKSLNYSVLDKLFSTYSGQFKFLVKIIETPEYIKTFYEINKERKQFILNLPLYFIQQKNLYSVTYKFKIAKIIEMSEFFFNANYLKDWNPITDLSLVNEDKIFNKNYLLEIKDKKTNFFSSVFKSNKK